MTNIYDRAVAILPAEDIDNHASDLYLRKSQESTKLIEQFDYRGLVTTFIDQIDHDIWYEIPFAFLPYWRDPWNNY